MSSYENKAIDSENGASGTHISIVSTRLFTSFAFHLVTDGTLTTAVSGGWAIEGTNAPEADNSKGNPDTTVFDWVDLGLTIIQPTGSATNQIVFVEDVNCRFIRIKWVQAGSGTGNVHCIISGKGHD